jgi:hypothetical protein
VFPISKSYIKSVKKIRTQYSRVIQGAIFSGGTYVKKIEAPETFAAADGTLFASTARTNFIVLVKSGATSLVKAGVFNFESGSIIISNDSSTATINLGDVTFSGLCDIEYIVESNDLPIRTKTLYTDQYKFANIQVADYKYSLGISDIQVKGIYKLTDYKLKDNVD